VLPFLTSMRHDPFYPLHRDLQRFVTPDLFLDKDEEVGTLTLDMDEDDEALYVEADLPGFRREEIEVDVDEGALTIAAERSAKAARKRRHLSERRHRRVLRRLTLPVAVDAQEVEAAFTDGVLEITLPKAREGSPRRIEVR